MITFIINTEQVEGEKALCPLCLPYEEHSRAYKYVKTKETSRSIRYEYNELLIKQSLSILVLLINKPKSEVRLTCYS